MSAHKRRRRQLDALYRELPKLDCQGKCADSCGPILMSRVEWERIIEALGRTPVGLPDGWCPMLTSDQRCSVYAIRPTICRLWGLVESLPCQWGCIPTPGYLTDIEGYQFLERAGAIGS